MAKKENENITKKEIKKRAKDEVKFWGILIKAEQNAEIRKNNLYKYCQRLWLLHDLRLTTWEECIELIELLVSYYIK